MAVAELSRELKELSCTHAKAVVGRNDLFLISIGNNSCLSHMPYFLSSRNVKLSTALWRN